MRTRDDLDAVFRLLEQQVDAHLATVATPKPQALSNELSRTRPPSEHGTMRTIVAALAAAATVAALVVGVTYAFRPATNDPAGFGANTNGLTAQSLLFSIDPSADLQIVEVSAEVSGSGVRAPLQEVDLFGRDGTYRIHLGAPGGGSLLTHADPRAVDVRGQQAHFGCIGSQRSGNGVRGCQSGGLGWQYAPDAWASVFPQGTVGTKAALLRIARALNFDSSMAVRAPISLGSAPRGMSVSGVDVAYAAQNGDGLPADKPIARNWTFGVDYGAQDSADRVSVSAAPIPVQAYSKLGAEVTSVNGHRAYWSVATGPVHSEPSRSLYIEAGDRLQLEVAAGSAWTLAQVRAFAAGITVTAHPDDQKTWFDANDALP